MRDNLDVYAGTKAYALIKDGGLKPEMVKVVAGAAGGPKWLVLSQLDRIIFGTWLKGLSRPLYLLGASIGAWRFAVAGCRNPKEAITAFESAYIHQHFSAKPPPREITDVTLKIQRESITDAGIREILDHPSYRLNILANRCKGLTAAEGKWPQALGLGAAALCNLASRRLLGRFFERALFSDPRDIPPFFEMEGFSIQKTPLTEHNFRQALLASGSIPLVMSGVRNIPGAMDGVYRDGGIIDYHLDLPLNPDEGVAFFPHYTRRIIPGWFDKRLKWRRPSARNMESVVLVAPSAKFEAELPMGKIPDRNDFYLFFGKDQERIAYWKTVVERSRRPAAEFLDAVLSGAIRDQVKPL